jgi:7-cyano-7-deazaguanine synthase
MISIVSASGGMDSTALIIHLLELGNTVHAVSFNYGQKHIIELDRLKENIKYLKDCGYNIEHHTFDLSSAFKTFKSVLTENKDEIPKGHYAQENMKKTVVPNRNAIFASVVYGYALSVAQREDKKVEIAMGTHSGDHAIYPDCRPEFFHFLFHAFDIGNWDSDKVNTYLPYIQENKESILRDCLICCERLNLDFDTVMKNTNTSYEPDDQGRANGKTGSDVERILAFHAIERIDPIEYIDTWDNCIKYALEVEKNYIINYIKAGPQ